MSPQTNFVLFKFGLNFTGAFGIDTRFVSQMLNSLVKYFQNKFLNQLGQKKMTCTQIV